MRPRPAILLSSADRAALVVWRRRMTLVIATAAAVFVASLSIYQGADDAKSSGLVGRAASVAPNPPAQWSSEVRPDAVP